MNEQPGTVSDKADFTSSRVSLKSFRISADEYRSSMVKAKNLISNAYQIFDRAMVEFHQCTTLVNTLREMHDQVRAFYRLLESPIHLPRSITPLRYPLLIALHQVEKQTRELVWYMTAFRAQYRDDLSQEMALRRKILRQLEAIIYGCEDIVENTNQLLDRARFQEKQLVDLV